jgi:hypothetical protein
VTGISGVTGNITKNFDFLVDGHFLRACFGTNYTCVSATNQQLWTFNPATANFSGVETLPPYSFQIDQGEAGVNSSYALEGCYVNQVELSLAAGQYMRGVYSILGATAALMTKSAAPDYAVTPKLFTWNVASLSIGGAAMQRCQDFKFTFNNNIQMQDRIAGAKTHQYFFRDGFRQFGRFTATADMAQTDWLRVKNETEVQVVLTCTQATSEYLKIDLPRFVFTAHPLGVSGPGMVTVGLEGRAMYSSTSKTIATISLANTTASSGYYGV